MIEPKLTSLNKFCQSRYPEIIKEWEALNAAEQKEIDAYREEQRKKAIETRRPLYDYSFNFTLTTYGWDKPSVDSQSLDELFEEICEFKISKEKADDSWITFDEFIALSEYSDEEDFFHHWIHKYIRAADEFELTELLERLWDGRVENVEPCGCADLYTDDEMKDFFRSCYYKDVQ